jgi:diguanylate cyclase (GGDEF)-like protein
MASPMTAVRPGLKLQDAVIVAAIMCAATLFAFEYEFFESASGMTQGERRITVAEFFALAGLLIVSLIGFSYWRLRQEKHHFRLRLTAEYTAREARHQAMHDPLTGLPNRRALIDAIAAAMNAPSVAPQSHALLLIDLNGFKTINDRFGHPVGDQLLQTIARRLSAAGDGHSIAARLGGDEFAVLCTGVADAEEVRELAQRIVASLKAPIRIAGEVHRVGAGVGIAFYPQDALTERDMFRLADAALYRAKATGRSAVCCHQEPQPQAADH